MSKLERFTRDDWFGFAGASKLPDGTDPLIAHIDPWVILVAGDERAINGFPVRERYSSHRTRHAPRAVGSPRVQFGGPGREVCKLPGRQRGND